MVNFFLEDVVYDLQQLSSVPDWLSQVATCHQQSISEINYIFCSDEYLLRINQEYLSHDYFTDILTFDNRDKVDQPLESDIFISIERVKDNANNLNTEFFRELLRVMVHGTLHLLGFSDHSTKDKSAMRELEDTYLVLYFQKFHN